MPIYEYACKSCGHELETLQFLNEDPLTDCPECGEAELRRKISATGFRLGGKGWYETDFKPKEKQRHVAGDRERGGGKSEAGDSGGGKSDSAGKSGGDGKSGKSKPSDKSTAAGG